MFCLYSAFLACILTSLTKASPDAFAVLASPEMAQARPAAGSSLLRARVLEVDRVAMD